MPGRAPEPTDQAAMRRANLSLVLRHLQTRGPRSRAAIAAEVGLNKATVSSLVAELVERGLVSPGVLDRQGTVGRPGRLLHVTGGPVVGVGATVNARYLDVVVRDLAGVTLASRRIGHDVAAAGPPRAVALLARVLADVLRGVEGAGYEVAGLGIAVPGLVDVHDGRVVLAPNVEWVDLPLAARLRQRLGRPDLVVEIGNDANLAAVAEHADGPAAGTADLVVLQGDTGVGAGILVDGRLLRGAVGFGAEVGHLPLGREGRECACGRHGCWETEVGLEALARHAARTPDDQVLDPAAGVDARLAAVDMRARFGDPHTLAALDAIGDSICVGAGVLVDLTNPGALVLGGYFGVLGRWLVPRVVERLDRHTIAPGAAGCTVHASTLGVGGASVGGALVALRRVLDDPTLVTAARPVPAEGRLATL